MAKYIGLCIRNDKYRKHLTINQIYHLTFERDAPFSGGKFVVFTSDTGVRETCFKNRFKIIKEI